MNTPTTTLTTTRIVAGYYEIRTETEGFTVEQIDEGAFRGWWRVCEAQDDSEFGLLSSHWVDDYPTFRDAKAGIARVAN